VNRDVLRFSTNFTSFQENLTMISSKPNVAVVVFVSIVAGLISLAAPSHALAADDQPQKSEISPDDLAAKLIGTWKLEEAKTPGSPSGIGSRLKLFTGTHWCIIQPDPVTGVVVFHHGGRYILDGSKLKTTRDFAGQSTKSMIGSSGTFTIQIDGDTMKQADANDIFNETWKRVK
jgi:hypothetical protein